MIFIKERFKGEHIILFLEKLGRFVVAVFERKNGMEINPVLIFGGNGTQGLSHIITNRAFLCNEYVNMPSFLGHARNCHSEEKKNSEHCFGHMNKVKKRRPKLPGLALILPTMLPNGRKITPSRGIKEIGIQIIENLLISFPHIIVPPTAQTFLPFVRTFGWFGNCHYKLQARLCCFVTIKR